MLGGLALVAALAAAALLRGEPHRLVDGTMRAKAEALRTTIRERTVIREFPLRRLAWAWARYGEPESGAWDADARAMVLEEGFRAVAWVDSARVVRRAASRAGSAAIAAGARLDDAERVAAMDSARRRRWSFSTGVVDVGGGTPGRSTIVPIVHGDTLLGYIVGETDAATWLERALLPRERRGVALALSSGGRVVLAPDGPTRADRASAEVALGDATGPWRLRVTARTSVVRGAHASMPAAMLAVGLVIALLLWLAVGLAQQAAARARAHARATRRLESEIAERERAEATLREREEQLRQSQKMEAVGRLAGGVAHDFNNLLTAISGHADFLIADLEQGDARRDDAREIKKAAARAAALTSQLLAFSRRQIRQPKSLDLNAVVADLERMLRRLIGEDIRLSTSLGDRIGTVLADPGQLEQVIVNLVVNASDASQKGGTISIATRAVVVDAALAARHAGLREGHWVRLDIADTGSGMDEATRARIFEPFFTTKEAGRGTGLGLSMVYAIVESSGGAIAVESAPGIGATFSIWLPRHGAPAEAYVSGVYLKGAPGGTETVLVAEDETGVRHLVARVLEHHGYRVLQTTNGRHALETAAAHEGAIHLLLTDVVMPEMSGKELAAALALSRPETRALFVSGYTDGEISRRGELDPDTAFLQKPFSAPALLAKVREVLDVVAPSP
jgi:signal transduction histidine kinase